MFHVGLLVVCVNDRVGDFDRPDLFRYGGDLDGLRRGKVYTIIGRYTSPEGHPCVALSEIRRPSGEPGYAAARFRPVDETKLSVFQAMLVSPPKETVTIGHD